MTPQERNLHIAGVLLGLKTLTVSPARSTINPESNDATLAGSLNPKGGSTVLEWDEHAIPGEPNQHPDDAADYVLRITIETIPAQTSVGQLAGANQKRNLPI